MLGFPLDDLYGLFVCLYAVIAELASRQRAAPILDFSVPDNIFFAAAPFAFHVEFPPLVLYLAYLAFSLGQERLQIVLGWDVRSHAN